MTYTYTPAPLPGCVVIEQQRGPNITRITYSRAEIERIIARQHVDDYAAPEHYHARVAHWQTALAACTPEQ